MARIAGILSSWPVPQKAQVLDCVLGTFRAFAPQASQAFCGQAAFGGAVSEGADSAIAVRGPLAVAVDGRVFNAREFGFSGRPTPDIFLDLYEQHGFLDAVGRLNADFAVSLYDSNTGSLWLGRDRVGVKPLYYAQMNGVFAFASQPVSLLKCPGVSRRVNRRFAALFAGSHYRTFDNAPAESPFEDIAQLPAGHVLEVTRSGQTHLSRYWTLLDQPVFDDSVDTLAEQYRELLTDAVRVRLNVSHPPAFLLSGGMDSSSVLACAVALSGERQHAFSSVYKDNTFDESKQIRSMLDSHVKQWHPINIDSPDIFSIVERMVRAHDEPVATATWLSHYLLCEQAAAQGFGALFGGLGGDELNAGEYEYFFFHFADLSYAGKRQALRHEVERWAAHHDHPIYRKNKLVVEEALRRLVDLRAPGLCLADRARLDRYASTVNPEFFDLRAFTPVMEHPFHSYLKNRTYQDIVRETAPCCLRAEDRQTTVFGLQHFDPFFDHRLIEFMFRVPGSLKIRDGVTKILLREATKGLLPEETRTRVKKTGWNAPAHVWFSGATLEAVRDMVDSQNFRARAIYNVADVRRIIDDHHDIVRNRAPRENHMMFLWQLVNLELWLKSIDVGL